MSKIDTNIVGALPVSARSRNTWSTLLVLSWRNLWRNYRRTLIMLAAIAVGSWAMIFMSSLMRGMVEEMLQNGVTALPGYVQVHHPQYPDDPSIVNSIASPAAGFSEAMNSRLVSEWFARVKVPAVIASERDTRGVQLMGVDPEKEKRSFKQLTIIEGRFLTSADDGGLVIGKKLADKLETALGRRLVVMSQDPDNNAAEKGYRIVGIYTADIESKEELAIYSGLASVQKMLKLEGQVSEIAVFGDDVRDITSLKALVKQHAATGTQVLGWLELDAYLGTAVGVMDGFVFIWILVIFIAMSFGLANTLIMAVFERVREIGLMMALGMRPRLVLLQILIESASLILLGLALGNALAFSSIALLADGIDLSAVSEAMATAGVGNTLYPALQVKDVISANAVVVVLGLFTSLLPAWKASRYDPVKALTTQ